MYHNNLKKYFKNKSNPSFTGVIFITIIFFGFFGAAVGQASAADHYVRADATGSADGSDWANAYTILPATLTRGDTYYIADGTYDAFTEGSGGHGYKFDDAESGSTYIYIKKATVSAHGTDTGWDNAYGDGQAIFKGHYDSSGTGFYITKGYYDIDGVTGTADDDSSYGFKFTYLDAYINSNVLLININGVVSHVQLKHINFATQGDPETYDVNQYGIQISSIGRESPATNLLIANNFFHDQSNMIRIQDTTDTIVENNYFKDLWSSSTHHGDTVNIGGGGNQTYRYNTFDSATAGTGGIIDHGTLTQLPGRVSENVYIYGNIFFNGTGGNGAIGTGNSTSDHIPMINWKIYNNTFVNQQARVYCPFNCSGIQSFNNLYVNSNTAFYVPNGGRVPYDNASDWDYNYFYNCTSIPAGYNAHAQTGVGDPFIDSENDNYNLSSHTDAGTTLSSPFDIDANGVTRTFFDRGAYEYVSSGDTTPPAAPSGLSVN